MEKTEPRKKYYIQPADLRVEISSYQKTGVASERLGEMLMQIASGLAAGSKWDKRTYRDDMASDAVVRMFKNLHLIDTTDTDDLKALCARDFAKNSQIKYCEHIPEEGERDVPWQSCVISAFDPLFDTCDITPFTIVQKTVPLLEDEAPDEDGNIPQAVDKNGELMFTEVDDIVFGDEIFNVDLRKMQFKKTNPFSYLTMIAHRVYIGRSFKENKIDAGIDQYKEECYSEFESNECISNRSLHEGDMDMGFSMHPETT